AAHIRAQTETDNFGNVTDSIAYGCTGGCAEADEAISHRTNFALPPGDVTKSMWRSVESWVEGVDKVKRGHTFSAFDASGNPISSTAELSGSLPLDRFHEDPQKGVAPPPAAASVDGNIALGSTVYDEFG